MGDTEANPKLVPALERGVRILDYVARARSAPSLTELARDLGLAKSSAHLLCNTLVQLEILIRRPDQTFQLGPHVMRWSNAFSLRSDVSAEFAAIWDLDTGLPGATITLTVLEGAEVVYIAARNAAGFPAFEFRSGMRLPAAFTATGKAFLSHMSEAEVRRLYPDGLPAPLTPNSVRTLPGLLSELGDIRRSGFSIDNQQVAEGMVCYGASVLDAQNRPVAGVAVSLPADHLTGDKKSEVAATVQRIAMTLSHRMGADLDAAAARLLARRS